MPTLKNIHGNPILRKNISHMWQTTMAQTPQVEHHGLPLTFSPTVRKRELTTLPDVPPLGESRLNTEETLNGVEKFTRFGTKYKGLPIPAGSHLRNERLGNSTTFAVAHADPSRLNPRGLRERQLIDEDRLFLRDDIPLTTKTTLKNAGHLGRLSHLEELEDRFKTILKNEQLKLVARGISMKDLEQRELTDEAIDRRVSIIIREGRQRNQQMAEAAMAPRKFHLKEPGLPPGWKVVKSHDGETYYYNPSTGKTTWNPPGAAGSLAGAVSPVGANAAHAQEMAAAAAPAPAAAAISGRPLNMPPQAAVQAAPPGESDSELYAWEAIRRGIENPLTMTRVPGLLPSIRREKAEEEEEARSDNTTVLKLRNQKARYVFSKAANLIEAVYKKLKITVEKSDIDAMDNAYNEFKGAITTHKSSAELIQLANTGHLMIGTFIERFKKMNNEEPGNPENITEEINQLISIFNTYSTYIPAFIGLYKVEVESKLSPGGGSGSHGGKRTRKYKRKNKKTRRHRR